MATTPEDSCRRAASAAGPFDAAASAILLREAAATEARLGPPGTLETAALEPATMSDTLARTSARFAPAALASYCAAAGEVERTGRSGSPPRALVYLAAAFADAESASDPAVAARAAYRIGLLGTTANSAPIGGRGARVEPAPLPLTGDQAARLAADPCGALGAEGPTPRTNGLTPALALECAVIRARAAGDVRLGGLASLRLARLRLVAAERASRQLAMGDEPVRPGGRGAAAAIDLAISENLVIDPAQYRDLAGMAAVSGLRMVSGRPSGDLASIAGRLAEAAIDAGRADDPVVRRAAERLAADGDDAGVMAFAAALKGRLALAAGDRAAARAAFERAIYLESQRPRPMLLPDWYLLLAKADPDHRDQYAHAAYLALDDVRGLLPPRDPLTEESTFELHMRAVFEAAADAELSSPSADSPATIARAQEIIEASRQAEIQSAFGSECIPPEPPIRPASLRPDEMILYPILLEDRTELLYARGGPDAAFRRLAPRPGFGRERVAAMVERLRASAIHGDDLWLEPARQLDDLLIAPIAGDLREQTTLVVMPAGPLRGLPFAALRDDRGRFLIQRTRLSLAPALSFAQTGVDRSGPNARVVAAALEREVDLPIGVFPRLANTGVEARAALGGGASAANPKRLLENFTRVRLERALDQERPSVLHLATHADFNGRSDRSFVVADGEVIPLSDLRGMIARGRVRGDPLDLLVLSACETAVGDDEASLGLAGAAVQAGARSALASIWQADDASTEALMRAFYGAYRAGASKSEALRDAQLAVLKDHEADPYYWGAFILIGGWR